MPKRTRKPQQWFQMRMIEGDEELMDTLTKLYDIDRAKLVRYALRYVLEERPSFTIAPAVTNE